MVFGKIAPMNFLTINRPLFVSTDLPMKLNNFLRCSCWLVGSITAKSGRNVTTLEQSLARAQIMPSTKSAKFVGMSESRSDP